MKWLSVLIALLVSTTIQAVGVHINVGSMFIDPIEFSSPSNLDFGNILSDIVTGKTLTVRATDGQVSGTGLSSYLSGASNGAVSIKAEPGATIDVEVALTGEGNAVFSLSAIKCAFPSGDPGTSPNNSLCGVGNGFTIVPHNARAARFKIGMTLTKNSGTAEIQQYTRSFTVTANYQ